MVALSRREASRIGDAMAVQLERVNTPRTLAEALDKIAELEQFIAIQRDHIKRLRGEVTPYDVPVQDDEQWVTQAQYAEHWRVQPYNVSRWCSADKLPTQRVNGRQRVNLKAAPPKPRARKKS